MEENRVMRRRVTVKKDLKEISDEDSDADTSENKLKNEDDDDYMPSPKREKLSDSGADSDYQPSPKKKSPKKKRTVKKEPVSPEKDEDGNELPVAPKKRKRAEKKVKDEDGNELPVAPKKRKRAEKKVKTEGGAKKPAQPRKRRKIEKPAETKNEVKTENDASVPNTASSISAETNSKSEETVCVSNFKDNMSVQRNWKEEELVAENANVPIHIARNVISLLIQDCTIPFIARYRKEMTGNLPVDGIREIQEAYENVKALIKKVDAILKSLPKDDKNVDQKVIYDFLNAKTIEDVEFLYAPFKPGSKKSLAERSKQLGLEPVAHDLLNGKLMFSSFNMAKFVDKEKPGIASEEEVVKGIQHIIADVVAKDPEILDFLHHHPQKQFIQITAAKSPTAIKEEKKAFVEGKEVQNFKFENYYNFKSTVKFINPHQVLALNRGETKKVLIIKLSVPEYLKKDVLKKCWFKFLRYKNFDPETYKFLNSCVEDAYNRLLEPHLLRKIRSELTKKAAKESVDVFCSNLKRLLLTPPVRGKTVLAIDPGFKHGCKVAVVSFKGDVLHTDVLYPHKGPNYINHVDADIEKLIGLILKFKASVVAIGNGTACRETESWLSNLIKNRAFYPIEVKYCIVNESGASIYSVSKEAEEDLPGLDPNLRSAASIARRLQDPLLEYVKVEPKHLGVGQYQHDLPETMLKNALDSVVVECVSFVGVDLNVCPEILLRKISGLSSSKAKQIIEWREKNGCFASRQQLLGVKGLGPKSFEQCAGFVKILPLTSVNTSVPSTSNQEEVKGKKKTSKIKKSCEYHPLDSTIIHPESYDLTEKLLVEMKATLTEVGQDSLFRKVHDYMRFNSCEYVAEKFSVPPSRIQLIMEALKQPIEYDIRQEFDVPLFQTGVKSLNDLKVNQTLTGRVTNVTHFGAFVDIGVGKSGLLHISKMRNQNVQLGDTVTVNVLNLDIPKQKIGLGLVLR